MMGVLFFLFLLFLFVMLRKGGKNTPREKYKRTSYRTHPKESLSRVERLGQVGEDMIARILYQTTKGNFQIFRNVYVPYRDTTSEIDLLMVHDAGIFVFESKNYSGWIFGAIDDLNWTQMFPNRQKYLFYNPVRQNRTHIKALSQYLNIPERFFYSYIVFSDDCELNKVPESTRFTIITQTAQLERQVGRMLSALPPLYSPEEVRAISDRILPLTNVDSAVKAKHIRDIRDAQESDTCPWCGGKLVTRRGKYGEFLGCSSYPRCKFKRNIMR